MSINQISSLNDPRIDVFRNVRDADLRGRDNLFMAESEQVIRRLLRTPHRVHSLLVSPNKYKRLQSDFQNIPESMSVYVADLSLISEIAGFHIHRGVLAAGYRLSAKELSIDSALGHLQERENIVLLAAEGITNVDNMGALFRNAAAFGVDGIILDPTCCDPLYRKAIRVSMGHVLSIPYAVCENWIEDLQRLKNKWNLAIVGAEECEHSQPLWEMAETDRIGIIFGSEGHGLSPATLDLCDQVLSIPMTHSVPSVNVAVASAVVLYELQRKRALSHV